jgi:hypothetical protein
MSHRPKWRSLIALAVLCALIPVAGCSDNPDNVVTEDASLYRLDDGTGQVVKAERTGTWLKERWESVTGKIRPR